MPFQNSTPPTITTVRGLKRKFITDREKKRGGQKEGESVTTSINATVNFIFVNIF